MTAIAYRDGVMAADTQSSPDCNGNVKFNDQEKLIQIDGYLIGTSGNKCPSNKLFMTWFRRQVVSRKDELEGFEFDALIVDSQGKMWTIDQRGDLQDLGDAKFFAVGSGSEVCLGAMEMGATAEQAVEAAIKWAAGCGGQVKSTRK